MMQHIYRLLFILIPLSISSITTVAQSHNPVESQCWFTATSIVEAYNDEALTTRKPFVDMQPGMRFQVDRIRGDVMLIMTDHAMGFWATYTNGSFSGECDHIPGYHPEQAIVLDSARLWTTPDVHTGDVIITLAKGTSVEILNPGELGRIRYDSDEQGLWYRVTDGTITGWIWAGRVSHMPYALNSVDAITLENARIWSKPDVIVGEVLYTPALNSGVYIVGEAVEGIITYAGDTGIWWQVFVDGIRGWIWTERLEIIE